MTYSLIDIHSVFIYKAVPESLKARVLKLPASVTIPLPVVTGFSVVDQQLQAQTLQSIDWSTFPEYHLTQCSLIDAFTALVHQYGYKTVAFYSDRLGLTDRRLLSATLTTLTGISAKDYIIEYTLKMIRDLIHRTDLYKKEIATLLHFSSTSSFFQFLAMYQ